MSSIRIGPAAVLAGALVAGSAYADLPHDEIGQAKLPFPPEPHRAYIVDMEFDTMVATRVTVVDPDSLRMLGMISTGGAAPATLSHDGRTVFTADLFYSRYTRGTRTDVLTAWDTSTLEPAWEVEIPPKRASTIVQRYGLTVSDDDRFVYVFNLTPATSVTVVDVQAHKVAGEVALPGCILNYPAGKRRFASMCGDGSLLLVTLDDAGQEVARDKVKLFDPDHKPLIERGIANAGTYHFVTLDGVVQGVDLGGDKPRVLEPWSLLTDAERKAGWAPGGWQLLAIAPKLGRLYVLMHPDHQPHMWEDPSTQVWIYDLATHQKLGTLESPNPIWTLHATGDDKPLLLGGNIEGGLEVFDLTTGKHLGTKPKAAKTAVQILSH